MVHVLVCMWMTWAWTGSDIQFFNEPVALCHTAAGREKISSARVFCSCWNTSGPLSLGTAGGHDVPCNKALFPAREVSYYKEEDSQEWEVLENNKQDASSSWCHLGSLDREKESEREHKREREREQGMDK